MKKRFLFCIFLLAMCLSSTRALARQKSHPEPIRRLFLIGGGPRPTELLRKFIRSSGGAMSPILVITWASNHPANTYASISHDLLAAGALNVNSSLRPPQNKDDLNTFLERLRGAGGIFFSGGDQNQIIRVLRNTRLRDALVKKYEDGFAIAGTSAGSAMMSKHMLTGNSIFPLSRGLGLLPNIIIDTHFSERQRNARLRHAIRKFPDTIGVGIDEGTGVVIKNESTLKIIGSNHVIIEELNGQRSLGDGEMYNLTNKSCHSLIAKPSTAK